MSRSGNLAMWQSGLNWMDDDEDQDSDTDSKLSGSAIVDSVMKQLRSHGHRKSHFEFSDSLNHQIREQDEEEEEEERGREPVSSRPDHGSGIASSSHPHTHSSLVTNGYRDMSGTPPGRRRQGLPPHMSPGHTRREYSSSPPSSSKNYYQGGPPGVRKDILTPVPEMSYSGARVVDVTFGPPMSPSSVLSSTVTSQGGALRSGFTGRNWPSVGASGARSMDALHHTPPQPRREAPPYRPPPMDGVNSRSHEALPQSSHSPPTSTHSPSSHIHNGSGSDVTAQPPSYTRPRVGSHGSAASSSHGGSHSGMGGASSASMQYQSNKAPSPSHIAGSHSHSTVSSITSPSHSVSQYSGSHSRNTPPTTGRTTPSRRANYERSEVPRDTQRHHGSAHNTPRHTAADHAPSSLRSDANPSREPNLNDVVDFLSSGDTGLVANAASYLQHLAYGDDSMKAKIRQFGGIPALIGQLRNEDPKVVMPVLGALRNLSFGRSNDDNKMMIMREQGLQELMLALKMSRIVEVRELITSVLWNLSSCEELKFNIIQLCMEDLVNFALIPYSGWNWDIARDPRGKPTLVQWNVEMRNITGVLRNVSSAGEAARVYMRQVKGLVDSLLWLSKAAVQQRQSADDKAVENVMCVLRNLSYQLESEVDLQDGSEDVLDREWEAEQRRELEEVTSSRPRQKKPSTPGCLSMCTRPRTSESSVRLSPPSLTVGSRRPHVTRPSILVDFANPDPSVFPKRSRQVQGTALLWQPEVVFPYLATLDLYSGCADTLEAAAGTIQNVTACSWKWAVYSRNMIRACSGLKVIAELLNNGHDAVVRAGATALRNLATDPRNKASLGTLVIPAVVPRLPFGSNHLGISESTTVALLVLLMEICANSPENAELFKDKEGIPYLTRLSRSRQHTTKIVFAANKICSILHNYKDCKPALKREGWEIGYFARMQREHTGQFEFETAGSTTGGGGKEPASPAKTGKKKTGKEDKKKGNKKKAGVRGEESSGGGGGVRVEEVPSEDPQSLPPLPSASPRTASPQQDPGYQVIATPSSKASQPQSSQPTVTSIYQTIEEVGPNTSNTTPSPATTAAAAAAVASSSSSPSHENKTEQTERGDGGEEGERDGERDGERGRESQMTSPSSGAISLDETDPNATYAAVEQIKERKRSSRREKQRQQQDQDQRQPQQPPPLLEEPSDSWV